MLYHLFFSKSEDAIRDTALTGLQTCALPIYRPPSKTVAQVPEHRRAEELHERVHEREPAAVHGGPVHAHPGELDDEPRQHRQDDAEADRVDQHRDENEYEGAAAGAARAHEHLS